MDIFNRSNAMNTGQLPILSSWRLISPQNSAAHGISVQISEFLPKWNWMNIRL